MDSRVILSFLEDYGAWVVSFILLTAMFVALYRYFQSDTYVLKQVFKTHAKAVEKDAVLFDGVDSYQFADYLLLLQGKIVVIKLDDSDGYIFGAENIHEWTCVKNNVTRKFANPLRKLNHFVTQVKCISGFEDVQAYVLFGSSASFPKGVPEHVLQMTRLSEDMKGLFGDKAKHEQAEQAWQTLIAMVKKDKENLNQVAQV